MPGVEIIAHRGASYDAPENTRAAIELAWRQNADAVEIDITTDRPAWLREQLEALGP
jgi:glycerophosphoryl diester phosphodiesterase